MLADLHHSGKYKRVRSSSGTRMRPNIYFLLFYSMIVMLCLGAILPPSYPVSWLSSICWFDCCINPITAFLLRFEVLEEISLQPLSRCFLRVWPTVYLGSESPRRVLQCRCPGSLCVLQSQTQTQWVVLGSCILTSSWEGSFTYPAWEAAPLVVQDLLWLGLSAMYSC